MSRIDEIAVTGGRGPRWSKLSHFTRALEPKKLKLVMQSWLRRHINRPCLPYSLATLVL